MREETRGETEKFAITNAILKHLQLGWLSKEGGFGVGEREREREKRAIAFHNQNKTKQKKKNIKNNTCWTKLINFFFILLKNKLKDKNNWIKKKKKNVIWIYLKRKKPKIFID